MKVAVSLRMDQSVATTLYQGKLRDWLVGKDKDCVLSKLCCSLALARKRRERKLLVGQLDWLKDQVITWGMKRAVLLYRFQLSMLEGRNSWMGWWTRWPG